MSFVLCFVFLLLSQQCFYVLGVPRNTTIDDGNLSLGDSGWNQWSSSTCLTECQGLVPELGLDNAFAGTWSTPTPDPNVPHILSLGFTGTAIYMFIIQLSNDVKYNIQLDSEEIQQIVEGGAPNGTLRTFVREGLSNEPHTIRLQPLSATFIFDYATFTDDDGSRISVPTNAISPSVGVSSSSNLGPSTLSTVSSTISAIPATTSLGASAAASVETTVHVQVDPPSSFPTSAAIGVAIGGTLCTVLLGFILFVLLRNRYRKIRQDHRAQHINNFPQSMERSSKILSAPSYDLEIGLVSPVPVPIPEKAAQEARHYETQRNMQSEIDTLRVQVHLLQELSRPNTPLSVNVAHDSVLSSPLSYVSTSNSSAVPYVGDFEGFNLPPPPIPSTPPPVYSTSPMNALLSRISRRFTAFAVNPSTSP